MAKKTNKTSHVMDLLTNGASGETNEAAEGAAVSADAAAGQEKKGDVQSHTVSPKKVTVVDEGSRNDRLSQEILNKLSEELEADTAGQAPESAPAGEPLPVSSAPEAVSEAPAKASPAIEESAAEATVAGTPAASDIPAATADTAPAATADAAATAPTDTAPAAPANSAPAAAEAPDKTSPDPAAAQAAPASPSDSGTSAAQAASQDTDVSGKKTVQSIIPKSQLGERFEQKDYHFVNVMELLLLRQDLDSYLEQYNVCKCDRCMADVCALVLTGLPAKYVVTSKDSVSPILGYYESKFKIYMLTELIKACNKVRESPRH